MSLLFLAITGLFLWIPHTRNLWKWSWIKTRLQAYILWPRSFHPAQDTLIWILSDQPSTSSDKPKKRTGPDLEVRVFPTSLDKIIQDAQSQSPIWSSIRIVLAPSNKNIQVFVVQTEENKIKAPLQLEYTQNSEWISVKKTSEAQQIKMWNKYTHTGQIFGIATQIAAFLGSLAVLFLSITGFILGVLKIKKRPTSL